MTAYVEPGDAVEGAATEGTSRNPLLPRGWGVQNQVRCFGYKVENNARATVCSVLGDNPELRILPHAATGADDELMAAIVNVWALKHNKMKTSVEHASGTHRATVWKCSCQSAAEVVQGREATMRAIENHRRNTEAAAIGFLPR